MIETRHTEKNLYFQLLVAKETGDYDTVISNLEATLEADDIVQVQKRFEDWKKKKRRS